MIKLTKLLPLLLVLLSQITMAGLPPTTSKDSADSTDLATFKYQFPNFTGTHTGVTFSLGVNSVAGGGTGLATLTSNNVLLGNGTGNLLFVAPGSNGNVLTSNGTTWTSAAGTPGPAGPGYTATSTTSLATVATGSVSFTTQSGLAYTVGARIRATSAGTAEWMEGVVTAYSGTTLTATMDLRSGTGTHADWNINLAGNPGATASGGTPAVVLGTAAAAGVSATFLRDDDTIVAFDATTPANVGAAAAVGTATVAARRDHTHTIGTGVVTRTMEEATGKGWQFLCHATASTAVRSTLCSWTGSFNQLHIEYYISGYSNSAVGRVIVGPTAGLSETATDHCNSLIEGVTITTTAVSEPGWPTAVTVAAVPRYGQMWVENVANQVKRMTGEGQYAGTASSAVPTQVRFGGLWSNATNQINQAELAVYGAITGTSISAITFNAGTYMNIWGRNDD